MNTPPNAPSMTYKDIHGWFDFADLYDLAVERAQDGDTFVEVGAWQGKSTAYMAGKIKASGKRISFFTVDTFEGTPGEMEKELADFKARGLTLFDVFVTNMVRCDVLNVVQIVKEQSTVAALRFADLSLSFCFIDAAHDYASVKADIAAWLPKVKDGGIIAGHDFNISGVRTAVYEAFIQAPKLNRCPYPSWYVEL